MEEIKVGEYIRDSISGEIGKVVEVNPNYYRKEDGFKIWRASYKKIKHSPNIIDLIEEGDYVNGKLIHKVDIRENSAYIYYGNGKTFCDYQIKDIVTKEQFEQMKYIVGDESNVKD